MSLPPLNPASEGRSNLGSLAQSGRSKKLQQAKRILIVVGVVSLLLYLVQLLTLREQAKQLREKEVQKLAAQGIIADPASAQEFEDTIVRVGTLIGIGMMAVSALYIVFGLVIKVIPVAATVISLILYVGSTAVIVILSKSLGPPFAIVVTICVAIALIQAVIAAIAYQKEQRAAAEVVEPEYE